MTEPRQYPLPLPHEERLTAEDFMVTESNSEAAAWIEQWPDWAGPCLVVHGPAGAGKSHLGSVWAAKSGAVSIDLVADAAPVGGTVFFFDNADGVAGKAEAEERLFHLFNRVKEEKGSLLLTAQKPPAQWGIALPDLRSRLNAAQSAALTAPDDALVAALLVKQFGDRQIQIEAGVVDYLIARCERSPAAIRALVDDLDRASLAAGRKISITLAREEIGKKDQGA